MSTADSSLRRLVAPGELRVALFDLLGAPSPTDIMLAAPGLCTPHPGAQQLIDQPASRLSHEAAFAYRTAFLDHFARTIDQLPQTMKWEDLIRAWTSSIAAGEVRVRQVQRYPLHSRLLSEAERSCIPQAPFAADSAASSHELAIELRGNEHLRARDWFNGHFVRALPIEEQLLECLEESWAGAYCTPRDIYYLTLFHYFPNLVEGLDREDDNPMLTHLTAFQVDAYNQAKEILSRYGGVFLADVVGLGKTYIALALLKHFKRRYGERAVVIAPPSVCPAWEQLSHFLDVDLKTISIGKLEELHEYSDRELVVIDESHNFRNTGTLRYETLQGWLRPDEGASHRKVLLLSATPQNNRAEDVKNQLALFPNNYTQLPYDGYESRDAWFRAIATGDAKLRDLLQHIIVRRTRRDIARAYPDATLRVRVGPGQYEERQLEFPKRLSGEAQCLRYSLDSTYGKQFYLELLDAIKTMHYPMQGVGRYLLPSAEGDPRVANLRRGRSSVRGLFKVLLLKRLESSIEALYNTLTRLEAKLSAGLAALDRGEVPLPPRAQTSDETEGDSPSSLPIELFDGQRLREDVLADQDRVKGLVRKIKFLKNLGDQKLARLSKHLYQRPPSQHKTIIFTQFADTAHYLGEKLSDYFDHTEVVTGARSGIIKVARRFAPKANYAGELDPESEIDLLISTDTLSEGVNLQDADTLINYDLHWNPTRLIQRAGRIDRLGSEHDEIHICGFVPQNELEDELGLLEILQRRIDEFIEVFGEDNSILPGYERPDLEQMSSAYTGAALEDSDSGDELDGLSRHSSEISRLHREEPDDFERIRRMRSGRRAVSPQSPSVVAMRCGWYWKFWSANADGSRFIPTSAAFDVLRRHAEAGEAQVLEPLPADQDLVERAREEFAPLVDLYRQRRLEPQLSKLELYILDRLGQYRRSCPAPRLPQLERVEAWVRAGTAQLQLRKHARTWRKSKLAPAIIFEEVLLLMAHFPPQEEDLGEPEVIGTVFRRPN